MEFLPKVSLPNKPYTKPESSELNTRYNLLTDQLQEILFGYFSHTLDHQHSAWHEKITKIQYLVGTFGKVPLHQYSRLLNAVDFSRLT